jgi:opacity protein-like surface antigen
MRHFLVALVLSVLATSGAQAADSCKVQSDSKKLSGAAQTSFMKKCETDAKASCEKQAADKKLSGAAKDSFTKKCVSDATGT